MSSAVSFVGRGDELAIVHDLLNRNQQVNIAAVIGMGGVGKTELALQYAFGQRSAFPGGLCWLSGKQAIGPQLASFVSSRLGLVVPEGVEDLVGWCWQHWPGDGAVLVIVDDVADYGSLKSQLPSAVRFRVLVTTRVAILGVGQRLELEVLTLVAALDLLRSLVDGGRIEVELAGAERLCEWLGRLPLGIELVGRYLAARVELSIADLLVRLDAKKLDAKALLEAHPEMTAKLGVAAAFELSWEPLGAQARSVAGLFGLFAAAVVDWVWVKDCLAGMDAEDLEDAQVELMRGSLLRRVGPGQYQVHPLVREFFGVKRLEVDLADELPGRFAGVITGIAKTIPQVVTLADQARVRGAVPQMEAVAARWTEILADEDKIWCCTGLASFYMGLSLWTEAGRCYERSLAISKAELGDRHPSTATSLNNLAELYRLIGRYESALPLYERALEIWKTALGDRDSEMAMGLSNLASLYGLMHQYELALPLHEQALEIHIQAYGAKHQVVATDMNNLADLYCSVGQYERALPLQEEALAICKTELGDQHPYTALSLGNLALLYQSMGQYKQALPLCEQTLEIIRKQRGDHHPDTAASLNNFAVLYANMEQFDLALPLLEEALSIYQEVLPEGHQSILNVKRSLENMRQARFSRQEAGILQAIPLLEKALGPTHPITQAKRDELAALRAQRGK